MTLTMHRQFSSMVYKIENIERFIETADKRFNLLEIDVNSKDVGLYY